jgi:hypothetical protein
MQSMMEPLPNLKHLRINAILLLACQFLATTGFTQNILRTINIPQGVHAVYLDRAGEFYIHQADTILKKFSAEGNLLEQSKINFPTIFDPWYGIELQLYYSPQTKYQVLNHHLQFKREQAINEAFAIEPYLVCLSGEKNYWVLDKADWSIKRINNTLEKVEIEKRIPSQYTKSPAFKFMREYQHFLFLLDQQMGILIFNGIGNVVHHLAKANIDYFNFMGEELYYKAGSEITYYNLFDGSTRKEQIDPTIKHLFIADRYLIKGYPNKVEIIAR